MRYRLINRRLEMDPPLSQEQLAHLVGIHPKTLSKIERGLSVPHVSTQRRLAKALGWTSNEMALALSDNGPEPVASGHRVPTWLTIYADMERAAAQLWAWQPLTVHALLQTERYAIGVESQSPEPMPPEAVAKRVELRLSRQVVLDREPEPLRLSVVLDESVLRRAPMDDEQLAHLVDLARQPNVSVRVLPLSAGVHSASFGTFTLLASQGVEPQRVCTEDRAGHRYDGHSLASYVAIFGHLERNSHELANFEL